MSVYIGSNPECNSRIVYQLTELEDISTKGLGGYPRWSIAIRSVLVLRTYDVTPYVHVELNNTSVYLSHNSKRKQNNKKLRILIATNTPIASQFASQHKQTIAIAFASWTMFNHE